MKIFTNRIGIFLLVLSLAAGCAKKSTPPLSLDEANKKFIQTCKDEYQIDVVLKPLKNTLWIYVPMNESFYEIKVSDEGPKDSDQSSQSHGINYLEGEFKDNAFAIKYDISKQKKYDRDFGYSSTFSEKYQMAQSNLLTALARTYIDYDENGEIKEKENPPEFFILIVADISKGLETKVLLSFKDLKRAVMDQTFQEEYIHRIVRENVIGNKKIVGDKDGNYLEIKEMTWPEFLMRQMIYRINLKFQFPFESDKVDVRKEILTTVAQTVEAYEFKNFDAVKLTNLEDETRQVVKKDELKTYFEEKPQGRLINIRFDGLNPDTNSEESQPSAP